MPGGGDHGPSAARRRGAMQLTEGRSSEWQDAAAATIDRVTGGSGPRLNQKDRGVCIRRAAADFTRGVGERPSWIPWPLPPRPNSFPRTPFAELGKRFSAADHRGISNHRGFGWENPRVFALRTNGRNWKTGVLTAEASPRPRLRSRRPGSPRALTGHGSFPGVGGAWASVSPRGIRCFEGRWPGPAGVASVGTLPRCLGTHTRFTRIFVGFSKNLRSGGPSPATLAARSAAKSAVRHSGARNSRLTVREWLALPAALADRYR